MNDQTRIELEYVLRLGDSALVLSHRLCEWIGRAPALEEELANANVALDLLGQATLWLSYAAELEDAGRDADQLAFSRDASGFRHLLLVEQPNGDYAVTLARQLYFDVWHHVLLERLACSSESRVAAIAARCEKEVRYHVKRSSAWVRRLGDGTDESHARMQAALDALWMFTGEMFEPDAIDHALAERGVAPDPTELRAPWTAFVQRTLEEATLSLPTGRWMQRGGKQGRHGEKLGFILAEMQFLQRAYPGCQW
jgi:ring-1,2-phenylacetyl-CoA epoxidase subunit PaaC